MFKHILFDSEANNLLEDMLDFRSMPYKLTEEARLWCISFFNLHNPSEKITLRLEQMTKEKITEVFSNVVEIAGHNIVGYDLPVLKLFDLLDYKIGYVGQESTLNGRPVVVTDTLIWSQLLNPDRVGGHSLSNLSKNNSESKSRHEDFSQWSEELEIYMEQDCRSNIEVYKDLMIEKGSWDYTKAYQQELKLVDLTLKQSLFGFHFDSDLAEDNLIHFDTKLKEYAERVNPRLPLRPLNKGEQKAVTPPASQVKKDLSFGAHLINFAERLGATLDNENLTMTYNNKVFSLPHREPLVTSVPTTIDDLDYLKGYLLSLGWVPEEWKYRDLKKDSKKQAQPPDKILAAVDRYVDSTLNGPFRDHRLSLLETTESELKDKLLKACKTNKCIVPVSPLLRVGTEKKLCSGLKLLGKQADFALDVTNYLTYKHRRNSISGTATDEDGEPLKGFKSMVRADGRISTPASTIGASTFRYKHKGICNIPRITSLEGARMRNLFGCGAGYVQVGLDLASLEARTEGHYVFNYTDGPELAEALIAEKPNDLHAFPVKNELLTPFGWKKISDISVDDFVAQWSYGEVTFVKPLKIIRRNNLISDVMHVFSNSSGFKMTMTNKHRVLLKDLTTENSYITLLAEDMYKVEDQDSFGIVISPSEVVLLSSLKLTTYVSEEEVGCVQVPSSFIMVKEDLNIFVSGNCLSDDTEILTEEGFKLFSDLNQNESVVQWNKDTRALSITKPTEFIKCQYNGNMVSVQGDRLSILMTPEHRNAVLSEDSSAIDVLASELTTSGVIPAYGSLENNQFSSAYDILEKVKTDYFNSVFTAMVKNSGLLVTSSDYAFITSIQIGCLTTNRQALIQTKNNKFQILIPFNPFNLKGSSLKHTTITEVPYNGFVYCVSVPDTYIVCRRHGKVFITGNSITARKLGIERDPAKSFNYAVLYGAGIAKLQAMLGVSKERAEELYDLFWESVPALKELKDKLETYWKRVGNKEFILGIDGRKLRSRFQHSLINLLFQSAGAIICKYALLNMCQELEEKGMLGDPLVNSYEDCKAFLMIFYHDELQTAAHPSLVPVHKFIEDLTETSVQEYYETLKEYEAIVNGEDSGNPLVTIDENSKEVYLKLIKTLKHPCLLQAEKYKKESGSTSDIGHKDNYYYVTDNNPIITAFENGLKKAKEDLKFRVDLGIAWNTGQTWGDCH